MHKRGLGAGPTCRQPAAVHPLPRGAAGTDYAYFSYYFCTPASMLLFSSAMKTNMNRSSSSLPTDALAALAARRREVENALLTQALCGRQPSPAVLAQLRRYEAGELAREVAFAGLYQGHSASE